MGARQGGERHYSGRPVPGLPGPGSGDAGTGARQPVKPLRSAAVQTRQDATPGGETGRRWRIAGPELWRFVASPQQKMILEPAIMLLMRQ